MYKGKFKIWIWIFVISLLVGVVNNTLVNKKIYTLYSPLDSDFVNRFDLFSKSNVKITVINNENADIIVNKNSDIKLDGYTKYENQFYSELIVFLQTNKICGKDCEFYISAKNNINLFNNITDLKLLFEAFEKDKTYTDIGLIPIENHNSEDIKDSYVNLDNKIKLYLPSKGSYYYDDVKKLIAYALNGYNYENIEDEELQLRVENIIKKSDFYNSDVDLCKKLNNFVPTNERGIYIAPSYIKDAPLKTNSNDKLYNFSFYPSKTINISYDLFIKDNDTNNNIDDIMNILKTRKFFDETGLKNSIMDFDKKILNTNSILNRLS